MKTRLVSVVMMLLVFAACSKKEPQSARGSGEIVTDTLIECGEEMIVKDPMKVGETGIMLPEETGCWPR